MERDVDYVPIIGKVSALKGFLSGGLLAGGLFVPIGDLLQIIVFIIGFVVFMETVIPVNRGLYAITSFFFLLVGAVIESALALVNMSFATGWLVVMFVLTAIVYLVQTGKAGALKRHD